MQSQCNILLCYRAKWFQAHFHKGHVLAKVCCQYRCLFHTVEMNQERFTVQETQLVTREKVLGASAHSVSVT